MPDRIIKESICASDTLNQLSDFEERFWHRLTVNCDDYGRFDARPAILKGRLFPLMESKTHKDMTNALSRLASVGLVELYEVNGKPFLQVVTWEKHQRIRAKRSKFPSSADICRQVPSNADECPRNPIQSESNPNPEEQEEQSAREDDLFDPDFGKVIAYYQDKIGTMLSSRAVEEIPSFIKALSADVVICAIDRSLDGNAGNWNYIRAILQNWKSAGVKSLADVTREDAKKIGGRGKQAQPQPQTAKKSFSDLIAERTGA